MSHDKTELRLNRFLARAGLGSRRGVESLIEAGRVAVNGETVREPGRRVAPETDAVTCDGASVRLPDTWRVFAFHKPLGVVCSLRRQDDRTSLAELRDRAGLGDGVVPVGRLDVDTSGLLVWTDDGDLAAGLLRPRHRVWKRYHVVLDRPLNEGGEAPIRDGGLELDGRPCLPALLARDGDDRRRWYLSLQEGRNRQVRRMFLHVGCRVLELHRLAVGNIELGNLPTGAFRRLEEDEITTLRGLIADPQN